MIQVDTCKGKKLKPGIPILQCDVPQPSQGCNRATQDTHSSETKFQLHSLVDVPKEEDRLIQLLRPSFCKFLLDSQRYSDETFCIGAKEAH